MLQPYTRPLAAFHARDQSNVPFSDNRAALLWHERRRDRLNESYLKRLFHLREALDNQDAAGVIYLRDIAKQHHCHSTLVTRANPAVSAV